MPVEGKHVFYVWFDALITYMTAVRVKRQPEDLWPADLHLIGKEIVRFHAVYWPAFLMAADLPLPKRIYAHGWLLFEQDKMSKSRGNIVRAEPIRKVMGADALRYFLLREIVFGQDGSFSYDALIGRYNSELANGLGNLASRTLTMIQQYRGGAIPSGTRSRFRRPLAKRSRATAEPFTSSNFSKGLESIWSLLSAVDKFIVEQAPWKLAPNQDPETQQKLDARSIRPPKRCASPPLCSTPSCPNPARKSGSSSACPSRSNRFGSTRWRGDNCARARRSATSPPSSPASTPNQPSKKCGNSKRRSRPNKPS